MSEGREPEGKDFLGKEENAGRVENWIKKKRP